MYVVSAHQARSKGVAWSGRGHPWATGCHLFATPRNFLAIFYCCFTFVAAKERSPETLLELSLSSCDILENSIFLLTHFAFDCDNIKYEISSMILYQLIPSVQI